MEKSDKFTPTQGMGLAASRGVALRSEFGRGGTSVGAGTARSLINGTALPLSKVRQMYAFFSRHEGDKKERWSDPSNPSNGYIAHLLWGGDGGYAWARGIRDRALKAEIWYS